MKRSARLTVIILLIMIVMLTFCSCQRSSDVGGKKPSDGTNDGAYFTVKFETFGGTNISSQKVKSGDKVSLPENPRRNNDEFLGWYKDRDCEGMIYDFSQTVISDFTLYAKWGIGEDNPSINYYTVTFDSLGGTDVNNQRIQEGGFVTKPQDPTRGTDEFLGWYKNKAYSGSPYDFSSPVTTTFTLYAKWGKSSIETIYYTVDFDSVGGTGVSSQKIENGQKVVRPNDPTRQTDEFLGWYKDRSYKGAEYDFQTPVGESFTLYARWGTATDNYSVVFDVNGGNPVIEYKTYPYDSQIFAPTEPNRLGYTFDGWYTDVGCTEPAMFPYNVNKDTVFYAAWKESRKCTINFRMCGRWENFSSNIDYSQHIMDSVQIDRGEKFEQPDNPQDVTYSDSNGNTHTLKFSYWNFQPVHIANTRAVLFPIYNTDVDEITLYAEYEEVKEGDVYASLIIHPENGEKETKMYGVQGEWVGLEGLDESNPYPFYTDYAEPLKVGYRPTGYYKSQDFTAENVYQFRFVLEKNVNDLYIRWEEVDDVTAVFDYGYDNIKVSVEFPYGGKIPRIPNPIRPGYTFDGWYWRKDFSDESNLWNFDRDISKTGGTLTAKWVKTATVIFFDTCGGYEKNPIALSKGTELYSLPTPIRQSDSGRIYTFVGWYYDSGYTKAVTQPSSAFPFLVDKDVTLYAKWDEGADMSLFDIYLIGPNSYQIKVKSSERNNISGLVVIPEKYNGGTIISIGTDAFRNCINVTEVRMPDTIQIVHPSAFERCTSLKKIVLGKNIRQLCWNCFDYCSELEDVNFPDGGQLDSIPADIFQYCPKMWDKLEKVFVGSSYVYYWGTAFLGNGYFVAGETGDTKAKGVNVNGITALTIRDGTTLIASYSMYWMPKLKSVTFADSVVSVTEFAFPQYGKNVLSTLNLSASFIESSLSVRWPENLTILTISSASKNYEVVDGCLVAKNTHKLIASTKTATTIPEGVEIIGSYSYRNKAITTVKIPNTVTTIYGYAFQACSFTDIDIPDSVGALDSYAFYNCTSMKSMTFGKNTPRLRSFFFDGMKKLGHLGVTKENPIMITIDSVLYDKINEEIIFAAPAYEGDINVWNRITYIPERVFIGNYNKVILPDSVVGMADYAFGEASLKSLSIGNGMHELGTKYIFGSRMYACDSTPLEEITVSVDNPNMTVDENGILYNKAMTKMLLVPAGITDVVIPDSVTVLDEALMFGVVDRLHIGAGVNYDDFFALLYGIEGSYGGQEYTGGVVAYSVTVSESNSYFSEKDGVIYTKDRKHLVYIPTCFNGDLELPKEMEEIEEYISAMNSGFITDDWYAEEYYNSIHIGTLSVEKGSALRKIGAFTVAAMSSIAGGHNVTPPYWIKSEKYERQEMVFEIARIDLHNAENLTEIGEQSFVSLTELQEIILPNSIQKYGFASFGMLNNVQSVVGGNFAKAEFDTVLFDYCDPLCDENGFFIVDDVLLGLSSSYFRGKTEATVPDNVTAVQAGAFWVSQLEKIHLPENLEIIKKGAFTNCSKLTEIEIPNTVKALVEGTFTRCTALNKITIGVGIERIDSSVFAFCANLTNITYVGSVEGWQKIEKIDGWDNNIGEYTVYCSDGKIAKDGTVTMIPTVSEKLLFTLNDDGESYTFGGFKEKYDSEELLIPSEYKGYPVTAVAQQALYGTDATDFGATYLKNIVVPNSVQKIGAKAFGSCTLLEELTVPFVGDSDGGKYGYIGYIFSGIALAGSRNGKLPQTLKKVTVSAGTIVQEWGFAFCDYLEELILADSINVLDTMSIAYCPILKKVVAKGVKEVGADGLGGNDNLTEIHLGKLEFLSEYALGGPLEDLYLECDLKDWVACEKEEDWNADMENFKVHCNDGTTNAW